jgi:hypothetical protein
VKQTTTSQSNLIIASTVTGDIIAVDPSNGNELWKLDSGEPLVTSYQSSELMKGKIVICIVIMFLYDVIYIYVYMYI